MTKSSLFVFFMLTLTFLGTAREGTLDRLPLGASPLKAELAALDTGKIMLTGPGQPVDLVALAEAALKADVIVIGEYHNDYACHEFQRDFLAALIRRYPRLVVGFEFFERDHDPVLEQWRQGEIDEAALVRKTAWYARSTLHFGYTKLVTDILREKRIRTIGLNVPRSLIRKVSMGGIAALSPGERALFPTWERNHPDHRFYISSTFGAAAVQAPQWFANIYAAQKCWDVIMAESMRVELAKPENRNHKGVIITGSAHVAYGLGIPFRYRLADRRVRLFTVVPVYAVKPEPGAEENPMLKMLTQNAGPQAVFSQGIADAVLAIVPVDRPVFPEWGLSGRVGKDGGFAVTGVASGGWAENAGLKTGDRIMSIDGVPVTTDEQLRLLFAAKNRDDEIRLTVEKKTKIE